MMDFFHTIVVGYWLIVAVLAVGLLIDFIITVIQSKISEKHEKECVENATKIKDNKNVFNEVKETIDEFTINLQRTLNGMKKNKPIQIDYHHYFSGTFSTEEEICEIHKIITSEEFVDAISPWEFKKLEWNNNTNKYFFVIHVIV